MKTTILSRKKQSMPVVQPRVKLWLEIDGGRAFCPGVCQILQEIERTGSIKDAAAAMQRSYRFVWGKLKQVETALGRPLVVTRIGGGQDRRSVLTELGQELMQEFQKLRHELFRFVDMQFDSRLARILATDRKR